MNQVCALSMISCTLLFVTVCIAEENNRWLTWLPSSSMLTMA